MNLDLLSKKISLKTSLFILGGLILIYFLGIFYGMDNYDFKTAYDYSTFARLKMNIYAATPTTGCYCYYLPFFPIIMIPFTYLPMHIASIIFYYINIILLIIICFNLLNDFKVDINTKKKKIGTIILIFLMIIGFVRNNLGFGQINIVLCFLGYLGIKYYYERKLAMSSFCLALSGFKIITLLFFFFVLFTRKIIYILFYLGCIFFFLLLPFIYFGPTKGLEQYGNLYINNILNKTNIEYVTSRVEIQSFWRLTASILKTFEINNNQILTFLIAMILLIVLLYVYFLTNKLYDSDRKTVYMMGSIYFILMLLFFPDLNLHHFTFLLLPFSLLVIEMYRTKSKKEIVLILFILIANLFYSSGKSYYLHMIVSLTVLAYLFNKLRVIDTNLLQIKR